MHTAYSYCSYYAILVDLVAGRRGDRRRLRSRRTVHGCNRRPLSAFQHCTEMPRPGCSYPRAHQLQPERDVRLGSEAGLMDHARGAACRGSAYIHTVSNVILSCTIATYVIRIWFSRHAWLQHKHIYDIYTIYGFRCDRDSLPNRPVIAATIIGPVGSSARLCITIAQSKYSLVPPITNASA